jgi:hypothetical protein
MNPSLNGERKWVKLEGRRSSLEADDEAGAGVFVEAASSWKGLAPLFRAAAKAGAVDLCAEILELFLQGISKDQNFI